MKILDPHAPPKKEGGENAPFMNKTSSKEFMHRTRLRNKYLKNATEHNKILFWRQRNFCVRLFIKPDAIKKEMEKYPIFRHLLSKLRMLYIRCELNIFNEVKEVNLQFFGDFNKKLAHSKFIN